MKKIEFYQMESGKEPFLDWVNSLKKFERAKIHSYVGRLAAGASKKNIMPVGEGVSEIKIDWGPGYRAYFGEVENKIIFSASWGNKADSKKGY